MKPTLANLSTIVFLGITACSSDSSNVDSVSPPPIPASDVDLIDNLVPHHEMALQMADIEIARGERADVKAMARMMRAAQQDEIARMREIRLRVGGSDRIQAMRDPHGEMDIAQLDVATGTDVDTMFLTNMIPHHAGAVALSHRALDNLSDPELREMAEMTIVVQTREMNKMLDMLGK